MNNIHYPSITVWEITLKCNLKCLHCGSSAGEKTTDELSTKEGVKLCRDLKEIGCKGVALMGGELFLRKDWYEIGREIKDLGMNLSVVSNGFCNVEDIIPKLTKLETDCVTVGLDGLADTHDYIRGVKGSFEKAVEFMRASNEAGLTTNAITTVHKINFEEIPKMTEFILEDVGVDWQLQEAIPIGRFPLELMLSEEEYYSLGMFISSLQKKYSKERVTGGHNFGFHSKVIPNLSLYPEWNGCYAGISVLGIRCNGDVVGCLTLSDEFVEGNIRDRSIIDIWNDPNSFAYNRRFKKEMLGEKCIDCKYRLSCKGGCTCRSFSTTGKIHNDPHCFYRFEKKKNNI
ncbi:MAG: radical SAM/SPASM domain-containing protein [Thermoplasmata archaeon]|nr:MAG: radical SAM/SPASM domain-containing protein [Thermoplasmata archaeon]